MIITQGKAKFPRRLSGNCQAVVALWESHDVREDERDREHGRERQPAERRHGPCVAAIPRCAREDRVRRERALTALARALKLVRLVTEPRANKEVEHLRSAVANHRIPQRKRPRGKTHKTNQTRGAVVTKIARGGDVRKAPRVFELCVRARRSLAPASHTTIGEPRSRQ